VADDNIVHGANERLAHSRYRRLRHRQPRLRRRHLHLRRRHRRRRQLPVSTGTTIGESTVRAADGITTAPLGLVWTNSG